MTKFMCPRRSESPGLSKIFPDGDEWRSDNSCSYCGSMNPDLLMARLEDGTLELGPTDKSYKVYVRNAGGEAMMQVYRSCPSGSERHGPKECTHWVTRETSQAKFYFQHLNEQQKSRFLELLNTQKLKYGHPGHFYILPYFLQRT